MVTGSRKEQQTCIDNTYLPRYKMRTKPLVVSGLLIPDVVEICKEGMDSDRKSIPDIQPSE
jgi:hypothetical protein